ncbi:MAG: GNAT family N-acetyltransferase [Chloroflexota bacterium]
MAGSAWLFADTALARRLEMAEAEGMAEYGQALARLRPELGAAVEALGGGYTVFAGAGSPLSRAVGLGFEGPITAADLDRLEGFYRQRGAPVQVDVCPLADASLLEGLSGRGYRLASFENVWLRPVDAGERFPSPPPAVRVAEIAPAEADLWIETVSRGFAEREVLAAADLDIAVPFPHLASMTCLLAWIGDEPAGAASLGLHRGLASLLNASTRLAFRGRGVQTALLHHRLALAAAAGCDLATVQTQPGSASQRNVERQGFRLAYTKTTLVQHLL